MVAICSEAAMEQEPSCCGGNSLKVGMWLGKAFEGLVFVARTNEGPEETTGNSAARLTFGMPLYRENMGTGGMFHGFHHAVAGQGRGNEMGRQGAHPLMVLGGHDFPALSNDGSKPCIRQYFDRVKAGFFAFMVDEGFVLVGMNMLNEGSPF